MTRRVQYAEEALIGAAFFDKALKAFKVAAALHGGVHRDHIAPHEAVQRLVHGHHALARADFDHRRYLLELLGTNERSYRRIRNEDFQRYLLKMAPSFYKLVYQFVLKRDYLNKYFYLS